MRQRVVLAAVGAAAFVGVGIATLPASLFAGRLPPDVRLDGVSGTVWNGAADVLKIRGAPVGALGWRVEPLGLLTGELAFRIDLTRADGFVRGRIAATVGGALTGRDLELDLPLTTLHPESRQDWRGELKGTVASARLEKGWPVALVGSLEMVGLTPPASNVPLGDFAVDFDGHDDTATQLVGRVRDVAAPLLVRAQLVIRRDRSYALVGEVTPRPEAAPDVSRAIAYLGTPDAAGRRTFEITGTF